MSSLERFTNTVNGQETASATGRWLVSEDPFTGQPWAEIPQCDADDARAAIEAAHAAFTSGPWPAMTATARGKLLRRFADLIEANADRLARLETRDNGKLFAEMSGQVKYLPEYYHYFGGLADKVQGGVLPSDKADVFTYTKYEPLGVVVCITPWNSPLLLLTWKLTAALAAGNTVVIKPSEFTSASTLEFVRLAKQAGFPDGVINTVTGYGHEIGSVLVEHPLVEKVAFTGGDATGAAVYAGAAKGLKHVSLELGGKIPEDAALADGWFVEPTIFGNVNNDMRITREEVFGPVLSIIPFEDDADAIRAGTGRVNTYRAVSFMAPFGGYKKSGLGRENGQDAIYEFMQTKCVWLNLAEGVANPFVLR